MGRTNLLLVLWATSFMSACNGGPAGMIEKSTELQRSGLPDEALKVLLEARVESPESAELLFAIAGAEVALGDHLLEQRDLAGARDHFEDARSTYGRCASFQPLAEGAAYNAATCLLRLDRVLEGQQNYAGRLENLRAAVMALDVVVHDYPHQARAMQNLNYARYQLALLLQSPPWTPESDKANASEDGDRPAMGVENATTQLPGATVEVEAGSVVVLRAKPREESKP